MSSMYMIKVFITFVLINSYIFHLLDYSEEDWPDTCKGNKQSPIDFDSKYDYNRTNDFFKIVENSYKEIKNYQLEFDHNYFYMLKMKNITDGGYIIVKKNNLFYKYNFIQMHWHSKSEHTNAGVRYDMELHLVHSKDVEWFKKNNSLTLDPDESNSLLAIGTWFLANRTAKDNSIILSIDFRYHMPLTINLNLNQLADPAKTYYFYEGSLTTPVCSQTVNWIVMRKPEIMSSMQLLVMRSLLASHHPKGSNRSVKLLNERKLYIVNYDKSDESHLKFLR
jgi:carbonic anhydrase